MAGGEQEIRESIGALPAAHLIPGTPKRDPGRNERYVLMDFSECCLGR
jgi:hypothetical protein